MNLSLLKWLSYCLLKKVVHILEHHSAPWYPISGVVGGTIIDPVWGNSVVNALNNISDSLYPHSIVGSMHSGLIDSKVPDSDKLDGLEPNQLDVDKVDGKHATDVASQIALYDANTRVKDSNKLGGYSRSVVSSYAVTHRLAYDITSLGAGGTGMDVTGSVYTNSAYVSDTVAKNFWKD